MSPFAFLNKLLPAPVLSPGSWHSYAYHLFVPSQNIQYKSHFILLHQDIEIFWWSDIVAFVIEWVCCEPGYTDYVQIGLKWHKNSNTGLNFLHLCKSAESQYCVWFQKNKWILSTMCWYFGAWNMKTEEYFRKPCRYYSTRCSLHLTKVNAPWRWETRARSRVFRFLTVWNYFLHPFLEHSMFICGKLLTTENLSRLWWRIVIFLPFRRQILDFFDAAD